MSYSVNEAYKDVEQVLNRPLGSMDFYDINNWFNNYDANFIKICIDMCRGRQVFSTKYITSMMFKQYSFYQAVVSVKGQEHSISATEKVEERKVEEDDNMCKEAGWEGVTLEEREYLVAYLKYSFEPNEYEEPKNPKNFDWREICNRNKEN